MKHYPNDIEIKEMLAINKKQTAFYQATAEKRRLNLPMILWRNVRRNLYATRNCFGINQLINELHWKWMGDLTNKRVLDLGCYAGNYLSIPIAEKSSYYLGIDLSENAINQLKVSLEKKGLSHAHAKAVDFLSSEFEERDFDVIYANGVVHHFKHLNIFLQATSDRLKSEGIVVTTDPLDTSYLMRIARVIYQPFQSNKEWEWPFTRKTFDSIRKYFDIIAIQGVMGYAKWAAILSIIDKQYAVKLGRYLVEKDIKYATSECNDLWRCLQVTMCWKKKS